MNRTLNISHAACLTIFITGLATASIGCSLDTAVKSTAGVGGTAGAGGTAGVGGSGGSGATGGAGGSGGSGGGMLSCTSEVDPSTVFAATEDPYGVTHADWNARWHQWWISLPKATHPNIGGDCAQGQPGSPAWFLASHNGALTEHSCTVPSSQGLLVQIHTEFGFLIPDIDMTDDGCINKDGNGVHDGTIDYDCLRQFVKDGSELQDWEVCLEVDGKAVGTLSEIRDYLVWAGPWSYTLDANDPKFEGKFPPQYGPNAFNVPEGSDRMWVSWGWTVMLKPLSVGEHVLSWYAIPSQPDTVPKGVTSYTLTVE